MLVPTQIPAGRIIPLLNFASALVVHPSSRVCSDVGPAGFC